MATIEYENVVVNAFVNHYMDYERMVSRSKTNTIPASTIREFFTGRDKINDDLIAKIEARYKEVSEQRKKPRRQYKHNGQSQPMEDKE